MSLARLTYYVLWIAPAVLLTAVATVMKVRRLERELPAFFAYCVFSAVRTPILLVVFHQTTAYFYSYWTAEALSAILGFAAIYEVFRHLFRAHEATSRLGSLLFRWTAAGFVLLAVVAAALAHRGDANWLAAGVLAVAQGVRLVQCGLLLFLFFFSSFSGHTWRSHLFGIAVGFGLFAAVQLVAAGMQAHLGMGNNTTWVWVNMTSYNCAVLVWMMYLLAPQPAEAAPPAPVAAEVKSWNQALLQLLQR